MSELTRRRVLAGVGAMAALTLAGCTADGEDDEPGDDAADSVDSDDSDADSPGGSDEPGETEVAGDADDEEGDPDGDAAGGTVLGEITVENLDDDAHVVDVLVEFDGEIEHWSTHELEAGAGGVTIDPDWPADEGTFRVTVRLDEDEFTEITPTRWNDPDCLSVLVLVGRDGGLRVAGDTASGACETGTVDE